MNLNMNFDDSRLLLSSSSSESEDGFSCESDSDSCDGNISAARDWCKIDSTACPPPPPRFPFTGTPGIKVSVTNDKDPLSYFQLFFTDEVLEMIVKETNLYAKKFLEKNSLKMFSRSKLWTDTNVDEMTIFFSILILQGIVHKPKESWYWARKPLIETPYFGRVMGERRYSLLMKFLHFNNNEENIPDHPAPKLRKIWNIFQILVKRFSEVYIPERDISIDESLMLFKGRLSWKQFIGSKRSRFGIKSFVLCEASSGYIWKIIFYTGKDTCFLPEFQTYGVATKSVLSLCSDLMGKGHCLTVDNYYMSPELAEILISKKTDVYGTVQLNRRNMPVALKSEKLLRGEMSGYQKGKILVFKWMDKKPVALLSTVHSMKMGEKKNKTKTVKKPTAVFDYNDTMGGVDKSDQCIGYYTSARKQQKKYYKKMFRHLLDQCIWNAFVLYKKAGGEFDHLDFRLQLAENIIERYGGRNSSCITTSPKASNANPLRLSERHFPSYVPPNILKKEPTRRCVVCCGKTNEHGKKVRRETQYFCEECNVGLCPAPCFKIYHTKPE